MAQNAEQQALEGGDIQASEQEQQQLAQLYTMSLSIIHNEGQAGDQIAQLVLQNQDVTAGIGSATSAVLIAVEKQAGQIPDDMKIQLALEIIAELSGLAVEGGALSEDEVDDSFIDSVASHAYSSYLSAKEAMGELDPQALEQSVREAEQLTGMSVRNGQQQAQNSQPAAAQSSPATQGGLLSMNGG